jgi:hypothetical protein
MYDMVVEVGCLNRVQRQFGSLQPFPNPRAIDVPQDVHKYYFVHYMTYTILTYSLHDLHIFQVQSERTVVLPRLGNLHGTMGCHLGSGRADDIPALVPSHGRVLLHVTDVVPASRMSQGYVDGYGDTPSPTHEAR